MNVTRQFAFARQLVITQLADAPGFVRAALGRRTSTGAELREPPDSALGRSALDEITACAPPALLAHSLRCWYLGDLFAQVDGVRADPELLYVACLLHDLGLTPAHDSGTTDFATFGAGLARDRVTEWGAGDEAAQLVAAAIDGHMDLTASRSRPEAYLLHAAAQCDVAARRLAALPADATDQLVRLHPRTGFVDAFADLMRTEVRERPGTRAAMLWRLGMPLRLRHNPLDRRVSD